MNVARVRACKARSWDEGQHVWTSKVYGFQARTVDEPVGKVHNSWADASLDAQAYNAQERAKVHEPLDA